MVNLPEHGLNIWQNRLYSGLQWKFGSTVLIIHHCTLGLDECSLVSLIMANKSVFFLLFSTIHRNLQWVTCLFSVLFRPLTLLDKARDNLWIFLFVGSAMWRKWHSRPREMVSKKVVYISLKWPVPRSELPYVAIWKSWEMMQLNIKGSVCVCVCFWYHVFMVA